eukprot:Em0009g273a
MLCAARVVASGLRLDVVGTVLDVTQQGQPPPCLCSASSRRPLSHALEELRHTDSEPQDVLCKIETVISSRQAGLQWSGVGHHQTLTVVTVPTLWTHVEHSSTSLKSMELVPIQKHGTDPGNPAKPVCSGGHTRACIFSSGKDSSVHKHFSDRHPLWISFKCWSAYLKTWGEDSREWFRFPVQESWCELMEAMSSVAEGATGVILARAGRSHVPEEVDEAIWHKLSSGSVVDGLKYSLVAGGVVMKKSLEQLQQIRKEVKGMDKNMSSITSYFAPALKRVSEIAKSVISAEEGVDTPVVAENLEAPASSDIPVAAAAPPMKAGRGNGGGGNRGR